VGISDLHSASCSDWGFECTYGALGLSRNICIAEELGNRRPDEARCCWKIAWKELSDTLRRDSGVFGSTALSGAGSKVCKYEDNSEGRDRRVFNVVLCVAVEVSNETITFAGSALLAGGGERRIGSKGGCGGDAGRLAGNAGTGGNESRTLRVGRLRLGVLGVDEPESSPGMGGGGRVGRDGVVVLAVVGSSISPSSPSGIGGRGGLFALEYEDIVSSSSYSAIVSSSDSTSAPFSSAM
jgi:hypothetical protein